MSKKTKVVSVSIIVIVIVLICGGFFFYKTSSTDREIKKGVELISEKQYEKAVATFELVLDDNNSNTKASELKDMVQNYLDSKKLFDENKFADAKDKIDSINEDYNNYPSLKDDVNNLKDKINANIKNDNSIKDDINKVRDLINENRFSEAKNIIKKLQDKKLDDNQKQQVSDLEGRVDSELEKADTSKEDEDNTSEGQSENKNSYTKSDAVSYLKEVESSTPEFDGYIGSAKQIYSNWDDALNFLWGKLKDELPESEFNKLQQDEVQWIKDKESDANKVAENSGSDKGSEMYNMDYMLEAANSTKERCYQLAGYLK